MPWCTIFGAPRTKFLLLNSPCNPTGEVYSRAELQALADVVASSGIWVIADQTGGKVELVTYQLLGKARELAHSIDTHVACVVDVRVDRRRRHCTHKEVRCTHPTVSVTLLAPIPSRQIVRRPGGYG